MRFKELAQYLEKIEQTDSRTEITATLAEILKKSDSGEVDKLCYLMLGRLAPPYKDIDFNLGERMMIRVLAAAFSTSSDEIEEQYDQAGDLGTVAEKLASRSSVKKKTSSGLSAEGVYRRFLTVAKESGEGSQERKIQGMADLLSVVDPLSARFIARIPIGKLRLGFSETTLLDALSWMISSDKSHRERIAAAYNIRVDVGYIAKVILQKSLSGLQGIDIQLGVPINPALCQRLPTVEKIVTKMIAEDEKNDRVAVEPKYDGSRIQLHFRREKGGKTRTWLFTRGLEDVTAMFPDVIADTGKLKEDNIILDGEVVGYDPKIGKLLPFQATMKRKRKHQVKAAAKATPLRYFCFDVLYRNGKNLLSEPLKNRREILTQVVHSNEGNGVVISPQIVTDSSEEIRRFHQQQLEQSREGVVIKKWQAGYEAGKRDYTWVKLKQEKTKKGGGLADTIDGVVMGYYQGRGRRADFGIGAFLLGVKPSPDSDELVTIAKIGTGLTDEQWQKMKKQADRCKVNSKPKRYKVARQLQPDVWCEPSLVVEVEADDVTRSPLHSGGLALRFPRLVRFRPEKKPDQTTSLAAIKKMNR